MVAARLGDAEMALRYLRETAATDLDLDPNSAGGVRIAGLGALWQAVMLGFAGLDLRGDTLGIDPRLPPQWRSLSFRVCWRGRSVAIRIAGRTVEATLVEGEPMEMQIAAATAKTDSGRDAAGLSIACSAVPCGGQSGPPLLTLSKVSSFPRWSGRYRRPGRCQPRRCPRAAPSKTKRRDTGYLLGTGKRSKT